MSDYTTIARPYAKAVFSHALSKHQLKEWSEDLKIACEVVFNPEVLAFISNPAITPEQQASLLSQVLTSCLLSNSEQIINFMTILVENKRLMVLPDVSALFEVMRSNHEKSLVVDVISFSDMSESQQKALIAALSQKLQRNITLNISIDKGILGGAIIHAGSLLIDGSVRNKLKKLAESLAA